MDRELYITEETKNNLENLSRALLDPKDGKEWHNPAPKLLHTGVGRPLTLQEQIKRVFVSVSRDAEMQGRETVEEANDFDVSDEFETEMTDSRYTVMTDEKPEVIKEEIIDELKASEKVISDVDQTSPSESSGTDGDKA